MLKLALKFALSVSPTTYKVTYSLLIVLNTPIRNESSPLQTG